MKLIRDATGSLFRNLLIFLLPSGNRKAMSNTPDPPSHCVNSHMQNQISFPVTMKDLDAADADQSMNCKHVIFHSRATRRAGPQSANSNAPAPRRHESVQQRIQECTKRDGAITSKIPLESDSTGEGPLTGSCCRLWPGISICSLYWLWSL